SRARRAHRCGAWRDRLFRRRDRGIAGGRGSEVKGEAVTIANHMTRRTVLGSAAMVVAAAPALAEESRIGPPPHEKGPLVFMNYDQVELDAAYDQAAYQPMLQQNAKRLGSVSEAVRRRIGPPLRQAYGPSPVEQLDIYKARRPNAPVFVMVHGGAWRF